MQKLENKNDDDEDEDEEEEADDLDDYKVNFKDLISFNLSFWLISIQYMFSYGIQYA